MKIENIKICDVSTYKLNSKKHPQEQVKGISESIRRFGFTQPIVVDSKNEIIIGHGRFEAAKICELKEVPCLRLENLNDQEVKALRLIDNRISETGWDTEMLSVDLEGIEYDFSTFNVSFDDLTNVNFDPASEDEQGKLDQKQLTKCPKCGEVFDHAKNIFKT